MVTCGSEEEAARLSAILVREHVAACVNITPVRSIYEWQGKLDDQTEWLLFIKSLRSRFDDIGRVVRENHSYENPEIIALDVAGAAPLYADWVAGLCKLPRKK